MKINPVKQKVFKITNRFGNSIFTNDDAYLIHYKIGELIRPLHGLIFCFDTLANAHRFINKNITDGYLLYEATAYNVKWLPIISYNSSYNSLRTFWLEEANNSLDSLWLGKIFKRNSPCGTLGCKSIKLSKLIEEASSIRDPYYGANVE